MKLLLLLCLLTTGLHAQDEAILDFIQEHRRGDENVAVKVPGWMISLASDIGETSADDEDDRLLFQLMGSLGTTRVVTYLDEDFTRPQLSVGRLLRTLERYKGFERWADLRTQDGQRVTLTVRYEKKKVKELLAIVTEEDRTTLVSARANLSAEELGLLVNQLEEL